MGSQQQTNLQAKLQSILINTMLVRELLESRTALRLLIEMNKDF